VIYTLEDYQRCKLDKKRQSMQWQRLCEILSDRGLQYAQVMFESAEAEGIELVEPITVQLKDVNYRGYHVRWPMRYCWWKHNEGVEEELCTVLVDANK
jgi:hypothetical protein